MKQSKSLFVFSALVMVILVGAWLIEDNENSLPYKLERPLSGVQSSTFLIEERADFSEFFSDQKRAKIKKIETLMSVLRSVKSEESIHHLSTGFLNGASELASSYNALMAEGDSLLTLDFVKTCAKDSSLVEAYRVFCFSKAVALQAEIYGNLWNPKEVNEAIKVQAFRL